MSDVPRKTTEPIQTWECKKCTLVYQQPSPTPAGGVWHEFNDNGTKVIHKMKLVKGEKI